jgi:hypothetical protein
MRVLEQAAEARQNSMHGECGHKDGRSRDGARLAPIRKIAVSHGTYRPVPQALLLLADVNHLWLARNKMTALCHR